jgi:hypothetical protein
MERFAKTPSPGEGFVVIHVNKATAEAITRWVATQTNQQDIEPLEYFEKALYDQINSDKITLSNGNSFDPRLMVVFLAYEDPPKRKNNYDIALDLVQGIPPIDGRRYRAELKIASALEALQAAEKKEATLRNKAPRTIVLTEEEKAIQEELIRWDYKMAEYAQMNNYVLPPDPLDLSIDNLMNRIRFRVTDRLGLGSAFPTLAVFETEWKENYKSEISAIEAKIKEKQDEERRQEQERLARIQQEAAMKAEEEKRIAYEQMLRQQRQAAPVYPNQMYYPQPQPAPAFGGNPMVVSPPVFHAPQTGKTTPNMEKPKLRLVGNEVVEEEGDSSEAGSGDER